MRISFALLFAGLIASNHAFAHKDRIFPIDEDGKLADFPAQFGPASLKVSFSVPKSDLPIAAVVLGLGRKRIDLPACITRLLKSTSISQVMASGSWYHEERRLPYYLSFTFFDPGYSISKWANPGLKLLFNMRTGELIDTSAITVGEKGRSIKYTKVELAPGCAPAMSER